MGYSKAPEQPQSSARPICHSHAMTRTGREPATIHTAAYGARRATHYAMGNYYCRESPITNRTLTAILFPSLLLSRRKILLSGISHNQTENLQQTLFASLVLSRTKIFLSGIPHNQPKTYNHFIWVSHSNYYENEYCQYK